MKSGDGLLVGSLFGVCATHADSGESVEVQVVGVFDLPKAAGVIIGVGALLYWNDIAKNVTRTGSGNDVIGVAVETAGANDATCRVRLHGPWWCDLQ